MDENFLEKEPYNKKIKMMKKIIYVGIYLK